jgi:hypothetical protein
VIYVHAERQTGKHISRRHDMSRAQGDGYRTHTDHELNAYKWRLRDKVAKLADHKEKWYRAAKAGFLRRNRTAW